MASKKFSPRERRWLEEYLVDGNATRAAEVAGYSATSRAALSEAGYRLKMRLAPDLHELMERMGLGEAELLVCLREGLKADRVELASFEGSFGDERIFPDMLTRSRYLEMALRLRGLYARGQVVEAEPGALDLLRTMFLQISQVNVSQHELDGAEDGE